MEIIFFMIGLLIGGITISFGTKHYFDRTCKDLTDKVAQLRELNIRILWSMEEAGLIEWNRDGQGKINGLDIKLKSASTTANRAVGDKTLH